MATENRFNKTKIRDFLEVLSNSNSGYIKADGNIETKNNLILGDYVVDSSGSYLNSGGSILIKKNGVSIELTRDDLINLKNIFTNANLTNINLQSINSTAVNDEILLNDTIRVNGSIFHKVGGNYINLSTDVSTIKTNITNLQINDSSQNSILINCAKLDSSNNFTGLNTFNSSLPTTTITNFNNSNQFVSKGYVDSAISGTTNISSSNFDWTGQHTFNSLLPTSTITPNSGYQLVNKNYVDSVVSSGSSSLFSSNNTWSGLNSFPDIIVDGDSINQLFLDIGTTNQSQDAEINNIKQVSLPNLDNKITTNTNNITSNTNNITSINNSITSINNSISTINTKNNEQDTSITNANNSITSINNSISSINTKNNEQDTTLSNCAKINQNNNFGNFTNTFNIIKINRIEKNDNGMEIYTESPIRFNTTNFFYKNGNTYDNLANKMNEKLNITNGTANNLTIQNPTFTGTKTGLNKNDVGLNNVDNTSDLNKPISSATQTALNLKLNKTSDTLQNCTIQNSTLQNATFSGTTTFNGLGINQCVLYPFIPYSNEEYINTTGGFNYYRTSISICFISSAYSTIDINLFEHGSDYNGYTVTFRKTQAKIMRFYAKNNTKIYDLALSSGQTSKTYTNEYSITITYIYNSSGGKHYVIAENKPT